MSKKVSLQILIFILILAFAAPAYASAPNFGPAIYGDGQVWGTKGTATLPAPTEDNLQSFDGIYIFINSNNPDGQLPVAEAAPGNPNFNGGRWIAYTVEWTDAAFAAYGTVPLLKSFDEVMYHHALGDLDIVLGHPARPSPYFQCPLLPVK